MMLDEDFIQARKEQLLALLAKIRENIAKIKPHTELSSNGDEDMDEEILEEETDAVSKAVLAELHMHEFRVLKALDKIAAGKYGFTDDGQPIPKERLEVVPEADTLVDDHAKI